MRTKLAAALAISAALLGGSATIAAAQEFGNGGQIINVNCEAAAPNQSGFGSTAMSFRICRNTGAHGNFVPPQGAYHYTMNTPNADDGNSVVDTSANGTPGTVNYAKTNQ